MAIFGKLSKALTNTIIVTTAIEASLLEKRVDSLIPLLFCNSRIVLMLSIELLLNFDLRLLISLGILTIRLALMTLFAPFFTARFALFASLVPKIVG